jgi:alkylhydroperoxidase/carboxymuconolactone decarboxylase family protein
MPSLHVLSSSQNLYSPLISPLHFSAIIQNERQSKERKEISMETYYDPMDLQKFPEVGEQAPELAKKFFEYYGTVFAAGALSEREKTLIALAVAHTVQCPYCIDAYTQACLEKGSNLKEMTEAVHVAVAIRGGASLVHGIQMRNIAQKISM